MGLLEGVYRKFSRDDLLPSATRQAVVDRALLTLLRHCGLVALRDFFSRTVVEAIDVLKSRFTKVSKSVTKLDVSKRQQPFLVRLTRNCHVFSQGFSNSRSVPSML